MYIVYVFYWLYEKNILIIIFGDWGDIILGVMQVYCFFNYFSIVGILFIVDYYFELVIMKLIEGLFDVFFLLLISIYIYEIFVCLEIFYFVLSFMDNYKICYSIVLF